MRFGLGVVPLPVVRHVFLLLVACHVFLHSRRYVPRVVLRYASAGRRCSARASILRQRGWRHESRGDHNSGDSEFDVSLHYLPGDTN